MSSANVFVLKTFKKRYDLTAKIVNPKKKTTFIFKLIIFHPKNEKKDYVKANC